MTSSALATVSFDSVSFLSEEESFDVFAFDAFSFRLPLSDRLSLPAMALRTTAIGDGMEPLMTLAVIHAPAITAMMTMSVMTRLRHVPPVVSLYGESL